MFEELKYNNSLSNYSSQTMSSSMESIPFIDSRMSLNKGTCIPSIWDFITSHCWLSQTTGCDLIIVLVI